MGTRELPGAEETLCRRFKDLVNAHDPAAAELLGPAPVVPADAVSPGEAERLVAELLLHKTDIRVAEVHREKPADSATASVRVVLAVQGSLSVDRLVVRDPGGEEHVIGRALNNPDVVVEVADGKIRGVRTQVHEDADARPMSPDDAERIKEMFSPKRPPASSPGKSR
jgi:hypothetical protein